MVNLDNKSMKSMYTSMKAALPALNEDRDSWVRKMMKWHFSEETGSPFWLAKKKTLNFDPLTAINGYQDLKKFGLFDKNAMKSIPINDLVPKGFGNKIVRIFETSGTTGEPIRVPDVTTGTYNLIQYKKMFEARGLTEGDILAMTPSGPHAYGNFVLQLGSSWNKKVFFIDFDPRWVKIAIQSGLDESLYIDHLVSQTINILKTQKVKYLFTTSKLLLQLADQLDQPLEEYGIQAVCTGGTSCSKEECRFLVDHIFKKIQWIDTYGNTLMGHALQYDYQENIYNKSYYLPPPLSYIEVVDFENWEKQVSIGERGRILLVTLLEDLFIPNLLERDTAIKTGPNDWYPWEGIGQVEIHHTGEEVILEGVY